jgi:hypothetical protein
MATKRILVSALTLRAAAALMEKPQLRFATRDAGLRTSDPKAFDSFDAFNLFGFDAFDS